MDGLHGELHQHQGQEDRHAEFVHEDLHDLSDDNYLDVEVDEDYATIFDDLKSKWLLVELGHTVSKTATDSFWRLALENFPKLASAQIRAKKKLANSSPFVSRCTRI